MAELKNKLTIFNGLGQELYTVDIDENTRYHGGVMTSDYISAIIKTDFELVDVSPTNGSYIYHNGIEYRVNQRYKLDQITENTFIHYINFEGPIYQLDEVNFEYHGNSYDPAFIGTAQEFATELLANLNRVKPGMFVLGDIEPTERVFVQFTAVSGHGVSCRNALAMFCEASELEFWIDGYTIHIGKALGRDTEIVFEVGQGKGLLDLKRFWPDDYKEYSRLKVLGSDKNLSPDYRGGLTRLTFDPGYIERPLHEGETPREATIVFDHIFPERTGTVTAVDEDGYGFTDSSIDFDLDDYRITGTDAQIHFKTGDLAGREFTLKNWNNTDKKIRIEPYAEAGYEFPSTTFKIKVGDTYTIWDIEQPLEYVEDAEARLQAEGEEFGANFLEPSYAFTNDYKFLVDNNITVKQYDRVKALDPAFGVTKAIRVNSIEYPLVNEFQVSFELSNVVLFTREQKTVQKQIKQEQIIKEIDVTKTESLRREAYRLKQLQETIFDPVTGEQTKLSATIIQAMLAIFGSLSLNFRLNQVFFADNYEGDPAKFYASGGSLIQLDPDILAGSSVGEWELDAEVFTSLDPAKSYQLYARCSKTTGYANWVLDEGIIKLEDEPGFWHFYVGHLYNVLEGYRNFVTTYGITKILGNRIKTGIISDFLETLIINLEDGYVQGELRFTSGDKVEDVVNTALEDASDALLEAGNAFDKANAAEGKADNALTSLNYMSADSKLTPLEKLELQKQVKIIQDEYSSVIAEAIRYSVPNTGYINAYTNLISYTNPLLANMAITTDIIRATFNAHFGNYYQQKAILFNNISGAAKTASENYADGKILTFSTSLGDLAFADLVGLAKLDSTLIDGGYIKTTLIDADWIKADVINVDYLEALELVAKNLVVEKNGKKVVIDSNEVNVAIFQGSTKLLEMDDDSSPGARVFSITFNADIPAACFTTGRKNDWSVHNSKFVSTTYAGPAQPWAIGDFSQGFPRFVLGLIKQISGSNYIYYFRYAEAGFNANDPDDDHRLVPNTSIGRTNANLKNVSVVGSFGTFMPRILDGTDGTLNLDTGFIVEVDHTLIYKESYNSTFYLPRVILGSSGSRTINPNALHNTKIGRELVFINKGSGTLTIALSGSGDINMFLTSAWSTDLPTISVSPGSTVRLKLISKNNVPTSLENWRWLATDESYPVVKTRRIITASATLANSDAVISLPNTGTFAITLPSLPVDGQRHEFVRAHSSSVTLTFNGNGRGIVYSGTVYTGVTGNVTGYHGTAIYIAEENRWYLSSYT